MTLLEGDWTTDNHQKLKDCQERLEKEVRISQKSRFDKDLETLNYRTNASRTHRRISRINKKIEERSNEAIKHNDKLLISDPFTFDELQDSAKMMDENKSPGPDGIFFEFISHLDIDAIMIILAFFNFVLLFGIPSIWRKAIIIPILKPEKSADEIKSYRPVALTSILCKLYEKMIMARLQQHLRSNKIMDSAQLYY